ncbi:MAG: HU family DNA-binding protein [Oscillospiraceae bacterium]|jgi:DNA-binding protein HU-beta|nr:HU family DNA-binding protein [Oscillospiraceae bacterium]
MTKTDLIAAVADSAKLSKKDAGIALDAVLSAIEDALAKKQKITLVGFGTFEVKHREARKGHNPSTGAPIDIAASNAVHFKAGKPLTAKVQ